MIGTEILAPGGSLESIYSALQAGCDAIYMGGKRYGARAFAKNPEEDQLLDVMDQVHQQGKKIYLTVNTIMMQQEMGGLYSYLKKVYEGGVDAVIAQDMGVVRMLHREFPDLAIHASTQMSVVDTPAVRLLKEHGVTRIVPARELTLEELARINSEEAIETEVFVHGALCCSMSGQCLMSSMIGGRSGNRGACAQPCRKEYRHGDSEDWQYYLSLKDLCTLELIPDLVKAGVDSFKIEGRMKKPEYVAITTYLYKKYLSYYYEYGESYYKHTILSSEEYRKDLQSLKEIYNRGGFTKGYLVGELDDKVMLSGILPSHEGVAVGEVSTKGTKKDSMVDVRYTELIHPQDVLAIRDEKGVVLHEYTTKEKVMMGQIQRINVGYHKDPIEVGNTLYRIRNNALIREIEDKFPSQTPLIAISGKFSAKQGEPIVLEVWKDGEEFNKSCALGGFAQQAKKHGATRSDVETKICVSGDSIFRWKELSFDMEEGLFLSGSELKQLRRTAFQMLTDSMVQRYHRSAFVRSPEEFQEDVQKEIEQIGECRTREQWKCLNDHQRITTIYYHIEEDSELEVREMLEAAKKPLWFVLPRVLRQDTRELFLKKHNWIDYQTYNMFSGLVVSSLEELELFRNIVRLRTLDNLYVRNYESYRFFRGLGVEHISLSLEMSKTEWESMQGLLVDVVVYGKPVVMVTLNHIKRSEILEDRFGNEYKVRSLKQLGYTEIFHYEPLDRRGMDISYKNISSRFVFTDESIEQINKILIEQ